MQGGGSDHIFGRPQRGGVAPDSTNMNKGREGVKNPENFADVLYGWPPTPRWVAGIVTPPALCMATAAWRRRLRG